MMRSPKRILSRTVLAMILAASTADQHALAADWAPLYLGHQRLEEQPLRSVQQSPSASDSLPSVRPLTGTSRPDWPMLHVAVPQFAPPVTSSIPATPKRSQPEPIADLEPTPGTPADRTPAPESPTRQRFEPLHIAMPDTAPQAVAVTELSAEPAATAAPATTETAPQPAPWEPLHVAVPSSSELPSDLPSNLPSDLTSNLPSELTSELPSNLPSNLPSELTSNQTSDLPSGSPASSSQGFARFDWLIEDDHALAQGSLNENASATSDPEGALAVEQPVSAPVAVVAQLPDATISPEPPSPDSATQLPEPRTTAMVPAGEPLVIAISDATAMALSQNPNIRVVNKTPQIARQEVVAEDAFFDPRFEVRVQGGKQDQQLTDRIQSFGGSFTERQYDFFRPLGDINNLSISQQLRHGGEYRVGIGTYYDYYDRVGPLQLVNPAWLSAINFHFEQPLMEGRGSAMAESLIAIAQVNQQQSCEEFRAEVNTILRDVEIAYWDVAMLERQAENFRQLVGYSEVLVQAERDRLDLGEGVLPDVYEAKEQYIAVLEAATAIEGQRREANQRLAKLIGYPSSAPISVQPVSTVDSVVVPNLNDALARLQSRPELDAQRAAVRRSEIELRRQINFLQPDLRLYLDYAITGLDNRLDDSLETVFDNDYTSAAIGLVLQQPIGRRAEMARVRQAQLALCQNQRQMEALQHQYSHNLHALYQQIETQREVVELAQQRVEVAAEQYQLRLNLRNEGEGTLDAVLRTQTRLISAQTAATQARFDYQRLLVLWYYEQGAIGENRIDLAL